MIEPPGKPGPSIFFKPLSKTTKKDSYAQDPSLTNVLIPVGGTGKLDKGADARGLRQAPVARWLTNQFAVSVDGCEILFSHHGMKQGETRTFVGIYRGIIRTQGFLGGAGFRPRVSSIWCEKEFDHPQVQTT